MLFNRVHHRRAVNSVHARQNDDVTAQNQAKIKVGRADVTKILWQLADLLGICHLHSVVILKGFISFNNIQLAIDEEYAIKTGPIF